MIVFPADNKGKALIYCLYFSYSVSFVGHRPYLLPTRVHTVTSAHTVQYVRVPCVRSLRGECGVFLSHELGVKGLSDPITVERLSSRCMACECNSVSAGTARPTTGCKCRSEKKSESSSSRRRRVSFVLDVAVFTAFVCAFYHLIAELE